MRRSIADDDRLGRGRCLPDDLCFTGGFRFGGEACLPLPFLLLALDPAQVLLTACLGLGGDPLSLLSLSLVPLTFLALFTIEIVARPRRFRLSRAFPFGPVPRGLLVFH